MHTCSQSRSSTKQDEKKINKNARKTDAIQEKQKTDRNSAVAPSSVTAPQKRISNHHPGGENFHNQ